MNIKVVFSHLWSEKSVKDKGTLSQRAVIICRTNVTGDVKHQMNETCDFLSDVTDAHILVAEMKHFGMTSMDDSPINNKPPPVTATRADDSKKYDVVITKFDNHFAPKRNVIHERAMFNKRDQLPDESAESFIRVLYEMDERCDFGAAKNDAIRDRLVVGISDKELSQRLQLKADLKLCDAITDIRQAEVVKAKVSAQSSATKAIGESPKKRRIIFKHDIDTNKRRKLIFDPPEENKPPEVDLSEITEVVNDLVNNVDKLLQDDLDVVDSCTTELQEKENNFEGSDQSATQTVQYYV
ncbi:hypothetical protein P5673_018018 [Acropora cervicornis]|uniref:Uncharacterized protein n=1 Tax=Acropora cervicornis TaxID=6130 RepID=A0AAD9V323_ACRCE|nr:hypothetical protein P5673_018018 [Acropora cervicornis]